MKPHGLPTPKVYCALFMGQGGALTSGGVWGRIAPALRQLGHTVDVFAYGDVQRAHARIDWFRKQGYRIVLCGYSLGTSTVTYLQGRLGEACDLLMCIAMSELESMWAIRHSIVKRAVLWEEPVTILSSAGMNLGFDKINEIKLPPIPFVSHLVIPSLPFVVDGVVAEVRKLG